LLIVITIIGILITLAQPSYNRAVTAAKEAVLKENLFVLREQIDAYYADNAKYPSPSTSWLTRSTCARFPGPHHRIGGELEPGLLHR
jgi:type II secretory pathway pseudopilin PulG